MLERVSGDASRGTAKKLIAAAVECAYGEPPPHELRLAWDCQKWNCLPEPGGLMDQDWQTMRRMTALDGVYRVVARVNSLEGKQIHSLTPNERRTLRWLKDEGLWATLT